MEIAILCLLIASVLLLLMSFFQKDPMKDVEKQVENFSISLMQEILKLKKKISILEEEMMIPEENSKRLQTRKDS